MLLELLSAHPHLLEGAERAQDGAADPGAESSVGAGVGAAATPAATYYLDLYVLRGDVWDLSLETLKEALEEGVASGDNHVGEEITTDVNVSSADRLHYHVMQTCKATSRQLVILNTLFKGFKAYCLEHFLSETNTFSLE